VVDVTSAYAVYGVMGPRSRQLLSRLSRSDFSDEAFPFGSSRQIDLGNATVRAPRSTRRATASRAGTRTPSRRYSLPSLSDFLFAEYF
jgi:sarcosine oxidase gamma subunit